MHRRAVRSAHRAARTRVVFGAAIGMLAGLAARSPASGAGDAMPVYRVLHVGTLIDGTGAAPRRNVDVLLKDDRIEAIGERLQAPTGTPVDIDLREYTVLPGFIDCHTHLTHLTSPDAMLRQVTRMPADQAIEAVGYAKATLEAGFTTVRDVGAGEFVDVSLKRAIDSGTIPGPRMIVATQALSIIGGHGDANGYRPGILEEHEDYTVGLPTGPDECRKAVRYAHKHGAGVIKIMTSGGVLSAKSTLESRSFSDEELDAIVGESTLLGLKVCSHAHGKAGILSAVRAGVASIEHGTYMDDECAAAMKQKGTYLVPTRTAGEWVYAHALKGGGSIPPHAVQKALQVGPVMREGFRTAYKKGVKIAFGSDAGVFPHGTNAQEFKLLTDLGMKPMEAIVSATGSASNLLGWNEVGTVQKGRYADFVVVRGDPLADITLLERPTAVIKGGEFVRDERATGQTAGR